MVIRVIMSRGGRTEGNATCTCVALFGRAQIEEGHASLMLNALQEINIGIHVIHS